LESGSPVSWRLNRDQARLLVTLPTDLGGWTYEVALEGGYTFTPALIEKGQSEAYCFHRTTSRARA